MKVIYEIKHGITVKRLVNGDEPLASPKKQKLTEATAEQLEFSEITIEEKVDSDCGCN